MCKAELDLTRQVHLPHGGRHLAAADQRRLRLNEDGTIYREVAHLVQQLRFKHLLGRLQAGRVVAQDTTPMVCCHLQIHHLFDTRAVICQGVSQVTCSQMPHSHNPWVSSGAKMPQTSKIVGSSCCSTATVGQCDIQGNRLELCSRRSHRYRGKRNENFMLFRAS